MANLTIAAIKEKQAEMRESIARDVEQIEKVNHVKKLEVENANCLASLLLAQNTIMELTDYLDTGMKSVNARVAQLESSNDAVKNVIQSEIAELQKSSDEIVTAIGENAKKTVAASLAQLDTELKAVSLRHTTIAESLEDNVASTQRWFTISFIGGVLWRWCVFMMLAALIKFYLKPDMFGLLNIWFFGLFL